MKQYYANPNNHFWEIIEKLLQIPMSIEYDEKILRLNKAKNALWDVIESCERVGSGDTSIKNEKPNDFTNFHKDYPKINCIIFNGAKAEKTWKKWFGEHSKGLITPLNNIQFMQFPSTSPRNPNKKEKLLRWSKIKVQLNRLQFTHNGIVITK